MEQKEVVPGVSIMKQVYFDTKLLKLLFKKHAGFLIFGSWHGFTTKNKDFYRWYTKRVRQTRVRHIHSNSHSNGYNKGHVSHFYLVPPAGNMRWSK